MVGLKSNYSTDAFIRLNYLVVNVVPMRDSDEETIEDQRNRLNWKEYCLDKGQEFLEAGYLVEMPDESSPHWMHVDTPHGKGPDNLGASASAKFYYKPSKYGINEGKVSKLTIDVWPEDEEEGEQPSAADREGVYSYERDFEGPEVNKLDQYPIAQELYETVLEVLN